MNRMNKTDEMIVTLAGPDVQTRVMTDGEYYYADSRIRNANGSWRQWVNLGGSLSVDRCIRLARTHAFPFSSL